MTHLPTLAPERPCDAKLVDALVARAFGPGRFAKAAERLREGREPSLALSHVAWRGDLAVGSVRLWPVWVGAAPALLLGPFAVEPRHRGSGLGGVLLRAACDAAARAGHTLIVLVGDEPYFAPFGFSATLARGVTMPGPVDQRRVLARALTPAAEVGVCGPVTVRTVTSSFGERQVR